MCEKKIKVVCLGDSVTEGFGLKPEEAYPRLLSEFLGEQYTVVNAGVTAHCVINETAPDGRVMGLPYTRTETYRRGLQEKADIYVIMLGTNDAQDGLADDGSFVDPYSNMISLVDACFDRHYQGILDAVKKASPQGVVYMVRPVPVLRCIWPKHRQKYLDIVLRHLDGLAAANPEVRLIDMQKVFRDQGEEWLQNNYQQDGLHPGPAGARLIARTVADAILTDVSVIS